jgi:hypothetical protein
VLLGELRPVGLEQPHRARGLELLILLEHHA